MNYFGLTDTNNNRLKGTLRSRLPKLTHYKQRYKFYINMSIQI